MTTDQVGQENSAENSPDLSQVVLIAESLLSVTQSSEALLKNLTEVVAAMAVIMRDNASRLRDQDGS